MTIPTPQTIQIPTPQYQEPVLEPLPDFISIPYITSNYSLGNYLSPELDPILSSFYKCLFFSVIENRIDQFYMSIIEVINNVKMEFEFEKKKLIKKHSLELQTSSNTFGIYSKNTFNGSFAKYINELHLNEMFDGTELIAKYKEKCFKLLQNFFSSFISSIDKINSLYRDIYTKDIKLTSDAYRQWIEFAVSEYNAYLAEIKANIERDKINIEILNDNITKAKASLEFFKKRMENVSLSNDLKEALNTFYQSEFNYLSEMIRFNFLKYELLKWKNELYSAELKKTATEIEKINTIAQYINENLSLFESKYDVEKTKIDVLESTYEAIDKRINIERLRLSVLEEEINALFQKYSSLYSIEKSKLANYELTLLDYEIKLLNILKDTFKSEYDRLVNYFLFRERVLTSIKEEFEMREQVTKYESLTRPMIDSVQDVVRNRVNTYNHRNSIMANALADWYRTCALTSAQITAAFIRSYA